MANVESAFTYNPGSSKTMLALRCSELSVIPLSYPGAKTNVSLVRLVNIVFYLPALLK